MWRCHDSGDGRSADKVRRDEAVRARSQRGLVLGPDLVADGAVVVRVRPGGLLAYGLEVLIRPVTGLGAGGGVVPNRLCLVPGDHETRPMGRQERMQHEQQ